MKKIACLLSVLVSFCAPVFAETEADLSEIIARARAVVGTEAAIDAVKTLTFEADVLDKDGKPEAKILLQYKKPFFCREIVRRTETLSDDDFYYPEENAPRVEPKKYEVEIETISDGFFGVRIARNLTTNQRNVSYLSSQDVLQRRDLVDANLSLYRSVNPPRGNTTFAGTQIVDGKKQNLVKYEYSGGLTLLRAFDAETGALVSTKTGEDVAYDVGEKIVSGGLTFLDGTKNCDADGNVKNTLRFTKISVNEEIPDAVFNLSVQELL